MSPATQDPIARLSALVAEDELISSTSTGYDAESEVWSCSKDLKPSVVVRPKTLESLSKVIKYLSSTDLDFKVRSRGYGSASAKDVLISLTAFDHFEYDADKQIVTLGAGANWESFYKRMEKVAPKQMSTYTLPSRLCKVC